MVANEAMSQNQKLRLREAFTQLVEGIHRVNEQLDEGDITRPDVDMLLSTRDLSDAFRLVIRRERGLGNEYLNGIKAQFEEQLIIAEELRNVLVFLAQRKLTPPSLDPSMVKITDEITLQEIKETNREIIFVLSLEHEVLRALKTFSKGSEMFGSRFDEKYVAPTMALADKIASKTKAALQSLRLLVVGNDVCVDDFSRNVTGDLIAELTAQGRRQWKIEKDLELIANFFTGG